MSVLLVASDDTDDLFAKADGQGEGESALVSPSQTRPISPS